MSVSVKIVSGSAKGFRGYAILQFSVGRNRNSSLLMILTAGITVYQIAKVGSSENSSTMGNRCLKTGPMVSTGLET